MQGPGPASGDGLRHLPGQVHGHLVSVPGPALADSLVSVQISCCPSWMEMVLLNHHHWDLSVDYSSASPDVAGEAAITLPPSVSPAPVRVILGGCGLTLLQGSCQLPQGSPRVYVPAFCQAGQISLL